MLPINAKEIPNFPGYYATPEGYIWSGPKKGSGGHDGKRLKHSLSHNGYCRVNLQKNGRSYGCSISRLVLETFVGPCPKGMEGCHNDGDKSNNSPGNLRWDTHSNNIKDAFKHGTKCQKGACNNASKLCTKQVNAIRELVTIGQFNQREIAEFFGVRQCTISRLVTNKRWKHI